MPKSKEYVCTSDDSSEEETKPRKKQKKDTDEKEKPTEKSKKPQKKEARDDEEPTWDLGNNRQVKIRDFKGKMYVDIREMYYDKDGDLKPGKKGICLNMQQWYKFMQVVEEVNETAKSKC